MKLKFADKILDLNKKNAITLFLYIVVIELVMCGSGQIIHVYSSLTLRMLLFILGLFMSMIMMRYYGIDQRSFNIFGGYLILMIFSSCISLINGGSELIMEDIKPRIFILIFPFFYWTINNEKIVRAITKIIRVGTLTMAIMYLGYLCLIKLLGIINFGIFYDSMTEESDFMFRGEGGELFYKGFVFLPIGLLFWIVKRKLIPSILILIAIVFTLTRAFYVIAVVGLILYYLLYPKFSPRKFLITIFCIITIVWLYFTFDFNDFVGDRSDSDLVRIITFQQVIENTDLVSFFIGHGMGHGVPIRPLHMENAFLEIFYKQGILGILYWMYFLLCISRDYTKNKCKYSTIYYISCLLIYIQSLFNPYLTNPIGLTMIIIGYIICHYYAKHKYNITCNRSI